MQGRDQIYLAAIANSELVYQTIATVLEQHHLSHDADPQAAMQILQLDQALCPRTGSEITLSKTFTFDAHANFNALAAMEKPPVAAVSEGEFSVEIHHPGGVGENLQVADGGSWLRGILREPIIETSEVTFVAIA